MKKINIRESLLNMDRETNCQYDLTSLYEACKLDDKKKSQLVKYIDAYDIDATNRFLSNEATSQGLMENTSDDIEGKYDGEEVTLKSTYYYDNVDNLEGCDFDDVIATFKEAGWIDENGNMEIPAGTTLTKVDSNFYYDIYEAETVAGRKIIPILSEDNGGDCIAQLGEAIPAAALALGTAAATGFGSAIGDKVGSKLFGEEAELDEKWEPTFSDEWRPEDIEKWKSIDWKARNYDRFIDDSETIEHDVVAYGLPGGEQHATATFAKEFSANPIFPPQWKPINDPFEGKGTNGWYMYDGHKHSDGYLIADRTETQEVSDMLSEAIDDSMKEDILDKFKTGIKGVAQGISNGIKTGGIKQAAKDAWEQNKKDLKFAADFAKDTIKQHVSGAIENKGVQEPVSRRINVNGKNVLAKDVEYVKKDAQGNTTVIDSDKYNTLNSVEQKKYDAALREDIYENDDWDYEPGVRPNGAFDYEGKDYNWTTRIGDVHHLDFDNWAVWEATNHDDQTVEYFIVDEDTEFIDWGPCETVEEAQEFLASKVSDWENMDNLGEGYELSPRIDYNPNHLRDDEGKIMADRWYASKWPDDEVGIEQLKGLTLDDALKDRKILDHCDTQVRERVYAQLDKYIPLSVDSPMYKEKNESKSINESVEKRDIFCTDCDTVTTQTYKGSFKDGIRTLGRYICDRCGCENEDEPLAESKSIKEDVHKIYVNGELKDEIESSNPVHEVDPIAYKYKKLNGVKEVRVEYADGTTNTMQVESINESKSIKEGMNWTNGEEEYEIDSTLASAPINSIIFIKKSYGGKNRTLKFEKVSTDKWDSLNKFNDRTGSYESDKSLKDKYIDGATWKLEKAVNESKSIKEDVEVIYQKGNKKIIKDGYGYAIDDGMNANRFYVTDDGEPKFDDGCSSKFWLDKVNSLIKAGKLTSRKNESKSIKESNNIAYGNEKYKGYMIRQDHKYGGYNVYDKDDEMEDSGFKTIDKAKEFIDSLEQSKSIKESADTMIYLFPELTDEDLEMLKAYGLQLLGINHGAYGDEENWAVRGQESSLRMFADKYLGYELHPDYLYDEDDFAGDIEPLNEALDENPIIAWLGEHEQAWEDFTAHFSERDIEDLSDDEIIGWISEHDQLYDDFKNFFHSTNEEFDDDFSDEELASIFGGDTKYDMPDGIETPEETEARLSLDDLED